MRIDFGAKPYTYPQPVYMLGSYDEDGKADVMNAAWGGISESNRISLCISENHQTTRNILLRKAFTVSMATVETMTACDYCGLVSGAKEPDKMKKAGLHDTHASHVDAPMFEELPMTVECRLVSYDPESCHLQGEIVNVCADERVLTDGKIDPAKLRPIVFDPVNARYYALGDVVGNAFRDGLALK